MVALATDTHLPIYLQKRLEFQESSYIFDTNPARTVAPSGNMSSLSNTESIFHIYVFSNSEYFLSFRKGFFDYQNECKCKWFFPKRGTFPVAKSS